MRFRILHVHDEDGKCFITGCFERCKEGTPEKDILKTMVDCIGELNTAVYKSSNVVLKDDTVYFRGILVDWLFSALKYWNMCLDLSLTFTLGKNTVFSGDKAHELFEKAMKQHDIEIGVPIMGYGEKPYNLGNNGCESCNFKGNKV